MFLLAQACDGVFTYAGIRAYGVAAEGNLVLATWMMLVGPFPTLFVAKVGAAGAGVLLYRRGIHRTLALLTLLYVFAAIGPWLVVLQAR
jgi:hypothetical protein